MLTTKQAHLQALESLHKGANTSTKSNSTPKNSAPKEHKEKKSRSTPKNVKQETNNGGGGSSSSGKKMVSIQYMSASKPKLQNRLFYDVINYLKEVERGVTVEELSAEMPGFDFKSPEISEQLKMNTKIQFEDGKYSFRPSYGIKNASELLDLINKSPNGIEIEQLKDSYKALEADLKKLAEQKEIFVIRNEETKSDSIFPNDPRYRAAVSEEFSKLWRSIKTPDDVELEKEMKAAGIASTKEEEKAPVKRPASKKKESKKRKSTNITNRHVTGVDILSEYVPKK